MIFTSIFVVFGLIVGMIMLGTILFMIGISTVTSDVTDAQEAFAVQSSELDEDWSEHELNFD